jgi:hypothetical protein
MALIASLLIQLSIVLFLLWFFHKHEQANERARMRHRIMQREIDKLATQLEEAKQAEAKDAHFIEIFEDTKTVKRTS